MADALPTNNESPNFDTYPADPEDALTSRSSRTYMPGTSGSTGAVPGYSALPAERSALQERAAQVGDAVGRAVKTVRRGKGQLLVMKSRAQEVASPEKLAQRADNLKQSARELKNSAHQRAAELAQQAQLRATELTQGARERASEIARKAEERLSDIADDLQQRTAEMRIQLGEKTAQVRSRANAIYLQTRRRTQAYVDENPFQALAIIGGAAFALGVALRIVRSRNAE